MLENTIPFLIDPVYFYRPDLVVRENGNGGITNVENDDDIGVNPLYESSDLEMVCTLSYMCMNRHLNNESPFCIFKFLKFRFCASVP